MKKTSRPYYKKIVLLSVLILFILYIGLGFISPLRTVRYSITDSQIPRDFDGYKIVMLTDFHCKDFGDKEGDLITEISKCNPDIICLTGDIVDESHSIDNADYLLSAISQIAPIYYVTGNHEFYRGAPYMEFQLLCEKYGVHILNSKTEDITIGSSTIKISGLDYHDPTSDIFRHLGYADTKYYNIMLYHDSTMFDFISAFDYNLVLAGHIHGGLIRLPFIGGLINNDFTLFPKYDYGRFDKKNSTMISSSGLGDARIPRWNNPREIVEITLHSN